jgi:hypothetical protein
VYAKNLSAKSIPELKRKIRICLKEMDVNLVQSIAGSVQKRLDTVHRKGFMMFLLKFELVDLLLL